MESRSFSSLISSSLIERFTVLFLESTDKIIESTFSSRANRSVLFSLLSLDRFDFFINPKICFSLSNSIFKPFSSILIILPVIFEFNGFASIKSWTGSLFKCLTPRLILSLSALISRIFTFIFSPFLRFFIIFSHSIFDNCESR